MTYKVIKNSAGKIVAFGLNDGNYEPTIKNGEIVSLQNDQPVLDTTETDAKIAARQAVLDKLGLTADEADAIFG